MNSSIVVFLLAAVTPHLWFPVLRTVIREIALASRPHDEEEAPAPRHTTGRRLGVRQARTRLTTWEAGEGAWGKRRRVNTAWDGGRPLRAVPPPRETPRELGPGRLDSERRKSA